MLKLFEYITFTIVELYNKEKESLGLQKYFVPTVPPTEYLPIKPTN